MSNSVSNGYASAHDPLCVELYTQVIPAPAESCIACSVIARVRAEERHRFDDDGADRDIRERTIRECIAALPHSAYCLDTWYDDKISKCFCESASCDRALRALQEQP